jgi:hypothetical protein
MSQVRVRAFPLRLSADLPWFRFCRHPPPPNNSFKPTPCRGIGHVLYATLAHVRSPATGRLNSSVRRQKSILLFYFYCFSISGFVCCALRVFLGALFFGCSSVRAQAWLARRGNGLCGCVGCSLEAARNVCGARPVSTASVSETTSRCCCSQVPTRLTIRSSRRRISASLKLPVGRAILAHNRRGRRGLTQALGGRRK